MKFCKRRTPEKILRATELRAAGWSCGRIAKELGVSCGCLIKGWLDEGYAERKRQVARIYREKGRTVPLRVDKRGISEEAERLLAAIPPDTRDLTARLCGDPLPGRRAIDFRREMQPSKHEVPFQ